MPTRASPSKETDATHIFLVLWNTYRAMLAKANESKKNAGLGDSDFRVLEALRHKGPLSVNVIHSTVNVTTGLNKRPIPQSR